MRLGLAKRVNWDLGFEPKINWDWGLGTPHQHPHDRYDDHGPGGGGVVTLVGEKGGVSNFGSAKRSRGRVQVFPPPLT